MFKGFLNGFSNSVRAIGLLAVILSCFVLPTTSFAWPTDGEWIPIPGPTTSVLEEPDGDVGGPGHIDIVGSDPSLPAAYTYADDDYLYYRIRLNGDPVQGSNNLKPFGWGFLIDTNNNDDNYEWMVMIDGIGDEIYVAQNTSPGCLGCPNDKAEFVPSYWPDPLDDTAGAGNYVVSETGSADFGGDMDYFIDFRFSLSDFKDATGIDENDPIRYFIGSSASAQTIDKDLQASSLIGNFTQEVLLSGVQPTDATVTFVSDATGTGSDVTEVYAGETIYVQVDDSDENSQTETIEFVTVTITTQSGDEESLILTETGLNTGIFTASISTSSGIYATGNDNLELDPEEPVYVLYVEPIDADSNRYVDRTDELTAMPGADIAVTKTVSNLTPNTNDTITYTLTVTNNGPSDVTGVEIDDNLPVLELAGDLEYVSDDSGTDPDQTYNSITGVWSISSLSNGASETVMIDVKVLSAVAGDTVTNTVTKTEPSTIYDPVSGNDSAGATVMVGGSDLEVVKSVDNPTAAIGESVTYTITVTNLGSNTASGVVLTDTLPFNGTELQYDGDNGGGTTSHDGVKTITWTIGDMGDGDVEVLEVYGTVLGGTLITNTALASTTGVDPDSGNDTATADIYVYGADVSITKSASSTIPDEGDTITYTVSVTNLGTNTVTNLVVTDTINSLSGQVDYDPGSSLVDQGSYVEATGVWTIGTVGVGVTVELTIDAVVQAGTAGETMVNTASITSVDQSDTDTSNDSATESITVTNADLSLNKSVSDLAPNELDTVTYTINVTNLGPDTATGVEVTETLPTLTSDLSCTPNTVPGGTSYDDVTGIWTVGTVTDGQSLDLLIDCQVLSGTALSTITNDVSITASDQGDTVSGNDDDSVDIYVGGTDLVVAKSVDNLSPNEGDIITYTITVTNTGPFTADSVIFYDIISSDLIYDSHSADGTYQKASGKWNIGTIGYTGDPLVDVATLTLTVEVDAGTDGGPISNTASYFSSDQADTDTSNNYASVEFVVGSTDVTVTKSVDNLTPTVGDTLTYTITVTNTGANTATGLAVTEDIPTLTTKLSYVASSASPTQGTYDDVTGIWTVGQIDPLGVATMTLEATVNTGTCGNIITNTVDKSAMDQGDSNTLNDSGSSSVSVKCADLDIVKIANDATPNEGETITYTLTVTNLGPDTSTNITVVDTLPDPVTEFITYLADDGGIYTTHDGVDTLTWDVGTLAKHEVATLEIYVTPDSGSGGLTISNSTTVSSTAINDPVSGNDTATYDISPTSFPNLLLLKTSQAVWDPINLDAADASKPKSIPGGYVDYTVMINNNGSGSADDTFVIEDDIPANVDMYVGDLGGGAPVLLIDNTAPSGLSILTIEYDDGGGYGFDPDPGKDVDDFNGSVTSFRVTISGIMDGGESISLKFRVRVQ